MSTTLPLMTAVQLEKMPDDGYRYDLLRGELLQMSPAGWEHGGIAFEFARLLGNFVVENNLGIVFAAETGFILERDPDTVLAPDVAFVRQDRFSELVKTKGFASLAPDLAVEVISPSDRYAKVDEKLQTWLDTGTRVVIILDPRKRVARVYRPNAEMQAFTAAESLTIPDVVPGWSVDLSTIFTQ